MMQIHELVQGSQEWLDHRANIFNASDAPAMMGCSPYKTRDELLREMATGIAKDTSGSEFLFAKGHEAEAKARPLAEMRVGDDLYPITGTNDAYGLPRPLGASFDGLTMGFDTSFEHKLMNEAIRNAKTVEDLGLLYRIQMEQQLMVCEGDRNLFMATNWNGEEIIESREFWYESDPSLREQIYLGWVQFAKDLEAYVHSEEVAKVEAAPVWLFQRFTSRRKALLRYAIT